MRAQTLFPSILALLALPFHLAFAAPEPQLAQGGGLAPATMAPSQYPIVSNVNSLVTIGGVTTVKAVVFTQTFAATALGSWDLGPTPLVGSIGLGDIKGSVGQVGSKSKRAVQTPAPMLESEHGWGR